MAKFNKFFGLFLKLGFVFSAIWLITQKINMAELKPILLNTNFLYLFFAIIAAFISLSVSSQRNRFYLQSYGLDITPKKAFKLYMMGAFLNTFIVGGVGGDGYKIYYLKRFYNFGVKTALRVTLYERTNGFYPLTMYFLIAAFFSTFVEIHQHKLLIVFLFLACTPIYLLGVKYILKDKIPTAVKASLYSYVVQFLQLIMAIFCYFSISAEIDFNILIDFMTLFLFASLISFIPISIGGIGLREIILLYGLQMLGRSDLITLGVSFAFLTFICPVISSLIGLKFFLESPKKSVA